jgi:glycosyltransferase involved in cell wall biosynthesis
MRIVIDLQGAQTESRFHGIGRYSLDFALAVARNPRGHEIWLLINGHVASSARELRGLFTDLVPPERMLTFFPPDALELQIAKERPRRTAAELTRAHLIRSVDPDCLLITSLIEPPGSEAVTTNNADDVDTMSAAILYDLIPWLNADVYLADAGLRQYYEAKLEEIKKMRLLLAISESSRQEAVEHLGTDPADVVTISSAAREAFSPGVASVSDLRPELGVSRRFIMYAPSGYDPRKNLIGLIQAFAQLPAALRAEHQLVITSKFADHDHERLRIAARKAGLDNDDLVLTGFVSDADLILLYRATELFVYPSLHEGFGLPALEAMRCGAPVIGSNRTSVPEILGSETALFDPTSVPAIADKITELLLDEEARAALRIHGLTQARKFSWEATADRALDAIENAFGPRTSAEAAAEQQPELRQRLALVTPMPPLATGIAFYAADLLPALARRFDVTLICDQAEADIPECERPIARHDPSWLRDHADEFDHIVYQLGNSEFHAFMVPLLQEVPGAVVLHDFFLSGMFRAAHATGRIPDGLSTALRSSHGDVAWRIDGLDEIEQTFPANRPVLNDALGVIVHSQHARDLIDRWYGPVGGTPIRIVELVRSPPDGRGRDVARSELGIAANTFLTCSFGRVHETKCDAELLRAWLDSTLTADPRHELHFVGAPPGEAYGKQLRALAAKHPRGNRVKFVGWAANDTYTAYLQAADVAVQLRRGSRGETSAAVLDCLNYGVPTIANQHGSAAELPSGTAQFVPDTFSSADLVQALDEVLSDASFRTTLSEAGRNHIAQSHSPDRSADEYAALLSDVARFRQRHPATLVRQIAASPAGSRAAVLPDVAQSVARSVRPPMTARQVLVDVTGVPSWPAPADADTLVLRSPSDVRVQFVHVEQSPRGPAFRLLDGHPRLAAAPDHPHLLADVRQGDVVVIAAAANVRDPACRAVYEAAQAAGARLAIPVWSSTELVDLITTLQPTDMGVFCADARLFDIAKRAGESHGVSVIHVDGPDVGLAVIHHVLDS